MRPQSELAYAEEVGEEDDPEPRLWVHCEGSHDGYKDMEWFIDELDDPRFACLLARAISGRGAFLRSKATLSERPDLVARRVTFSSDRQRGRARNWLAAEGYMPTWPSGDLNKGTHRRRYDPGTERLVAVVVVRLSGESAREPDGLEVVTAVHSRGER